MEAAKKIKRISGKTRRRSRRGRPAKSDRLMLSAIFYVLRSGIAWRDLPAAYGPWSSVYSRWRRWIACGLWARLLRAAARRACGTTRFVDSTHIKIHQDGANPADQWATQALGRTKGGINTKVTAVVDCYGRPVAVSLHPGSRNDVQTLDQSGRLWRGRTLVADKGFDADSLRARIRRAGGTTCIPRRQNCGTRPFCRRLYRRRHRVENFFCRIKRHRRIATRYDKLAATFLAFVLFAAALDWLKN